MPPALLRRAEPLVSASGVPSPALPPTPSTTTSERPYTLLQTIPRRHRSLRDKVGSRLKKLLARAKAFTVPDARVQMHRETPRPREFEDLGSGPPGGRQRTHRRTLSDTSQFIASVRRLARRSLTSVPAPSPQPPSIDSSSGELAEKPSPSLELGGLHPNAAGGGAQSRSAGASPHRRPVTLIQTRSHASSTPRVEEEDEHALEAYNSESQAETTHTQFLAPSYVPESPTTYKDRGEGPYVAGEGAAGKSLFVDEAGPSSSGTGTDERVPVLGLVELVDEDRTPGAESKPGAPESYDFAAPNPGSNANGSPSGSASANGGLPKPANATSSKPAGSNASSKSANPSATSKSPQANTAPAYVHPQSIQQATGDELEPKVPALLVQGTPMLKITQKKTRQKFFKLDADQGLVTWESEKAGIINIENIKEIRIGEAARYYRELFKVPLEREDRWLTIVYTSDNKYKILHVLAYSPTTAQLWARTLLSLRELRQNVMSGLVSPARMWERHYWRGADMSQDERLELEEVERLCRRLNVRLRRGELLERFKSADKGGKGYLDFSDFQQFVKKLQARPEVKRLWNKLRGEGLFDLGVFERFMREEQKQRDLPQEEIERIFAKYAGSTAPTPVTSMASSPETCPRPASPVRSNTSPPNSRPASPAIRRNTSPAPRARSRSRSRSRTSSFAKLVPNALSGRITPSAFSSSEHHHYRAEHEEYTIAAGLAPSTALAVQPHWTLDDFSAFLLSADNAAFGDSTHDMNRPLSEYFISSSHNTYLVGHQLVGESTIEGYIRALECGCRSVEVDIWDGDTEPVITHGRTLTGSVSLRHVAQAIAKYAFVASPYPVIISAEMHAGIEQQSQVAAIFREAFGAALVTAPIEGSTWSGPSDLEELDALPSPEQLKGRVLVKFKNALLSEVEVEVDHEDEWTEETGSSDVESAREVGRAMSIAKRMRRSFRAPKRPDPSELFPSAPSNPYNLDPMSATLAPPTTTAPPTLSVPLPPPTSPPRKKQRAYSNISEHYEKPKLKMSRSLVDLLIYTVGVKFRGLNKKERYGVEQMFSLSEKTANKVAKENAMGLVKHCRSNLVRLYPNGTRVTSTNYDPTRYWAAGVQLVALNWQTIDLGNMMNQALFQRNNKSGYLLKPEALRLKDCKEKLMRRTEYFLDITVISAQQVPRRRDEFGREIIKDEIMDPLVEVSLHVPDWPTAPTQDPGSPPSKNASGTSGKKAESSGKKSDAKSSERRTYRTTAVKNNGFNPVWEESVSIPFTCVGDMWDLVFVKFTVLDDDDDDEPLALYCASLGSLRQGYRHLPLHDLQFSQYLFSTLFVHISLRRAN
ncbi:Phospholipase C [Ceratobasidium sp. 370]|nr:Phospholipase C [Ceratobasidium sp. 370]